MAKIFNYETREGMTLPSAYARPIEIHLDLPFKLARINFGVYVNKAARNANKKTVYVKSYLVTGTSFDNYFAPAKLKLKDVVAICYDVAVETLDTNGASFFNGSADD